MSVMGVKRPTMYSPEEEWVAWHIQECRNEAPAERADTLWRVAVVTIRSVKLHRVICDRFGWSMFDMAAMRRDIRVARRLNHLSLVARREASHDPH